jgi:hypothetical protein
MLVHKNEQQTQRLINHLAKDFDIFVHIDKCSKIKILESNNVFIYKKYKTYWGSFNQIIATLFLLKKAYKKQYERYILISGQDLPLMANDKIKNFFMNNDNEYIEIFKIPRNDGHHPNPLVERMIYFHGLKKWNIILRLRRKLNHIRCKGDLCRDVDYIFYGGSNWTNYTYNCVKKIFEYLDKDKKYIKRYRWTRCGDEIFYQTIIGRIKGINIVNHCLRYVDWETGPEHPRTLREEDYEKIIGSKALFGRKFDENIDKDIIENIYKRIGENI